MEYKLGRKAVKTDSRTLRLVRYLGTLPLPPETVDWTHGISDWGMLLNNLVGDCTIAGAFHLCMAWSGNASGLTDTVTDQEALSYYEKWCGYNPANPASDRGGVLLDILRNWKAQTLEGNSLSAYASVTPGNTLEVRQAVYLFGGLYAGMNFPETAFRQILWDVVPGSPLAGGHCVPIVGYNMVGPIAISWGAVHQMTWRFWNTYFDEAFACLSMEWIDRTGHAPNGLALAQLQQDAAELA